MEIACWKTTAARFRAIAVIRADDWELGYRMALAVAQGGIRLIEITWNSDRAADLITRLRPALPTCVIGAGTLLTETHLQQAIAAGAQFLFSPHVSPTMIQQATQRSVPLIAGALSPTEILQAWQAGASSVKVFPVQALGGVDYIQSLQGPLGDIPLIPTGGVTLDNAAAFLRAGALAVGLSGCLFPKPALMTSDWGVIRDRAALLMQIVHPEAGTRLTSESSGVLD